MERPTIFKNGKPSISMGHQQTMAMLVITRGCVLRFLENRRNPEDPHSGKCWNMLKHLLGNNHYYYCCLKTTFVEFNHDLCWLNHPLIIRLVLKSLHHWGVIINFTKDTLTRTQRFSSGAFSPGQPMSAGSQCQSKKQFSHVFPVRYHGNHSGH